MEKDLVKIITEYANEHQLNILVWIAIILLVAWGIPYITKRIHEAVNIFVEIREKLKQIEPKKDSNMKQGLKSVAVANNKLQEMCVKEDADRCLVYLCHNGIHSKNMIDFHKFSVIAEGGSGRFGTILQQIQSVPSMMYGHWVNIWIEDGVIAVNDIAEIKKSLPGVHNLLKSHQVQSLCVLPVWPRDKKDSRNRTPDDMPDGFGLIEFCKESHTFSTEEIASYRFEFQQIYETLEAAKAVKES